MKKILYLFLILLIMLSQDMILNAEGINTGLDGEKTERQREREIKLIPIYEKYYKNGTDFRKLSIEESMLLLKYSGSIDSKGIGDSGTKSLIRQAFENIADSEKLLEELFIISETKAGKVYALLGLKCLNKTLYEKYLEEIDLEEMVGVQEGCLGFGEKIGDLLNSWSARICILTNKETISKSDSEVITIKNTLIQSIIENKSLNKKTQD